MSNEREFRRKLLSTELAALNAAVDEAMERRKQWMDAHMEDFADYKVGEVIYNKVDGQKLGVVCKLYRNPGGNEEFDRHMSIYYEYKVAGGIGNTSSIRAIPCNAMEMAMKLEAEAERLRRKHA